MVGEVVLRWEVLNRESSSEECLELWRENIRGLSGFVSLFHNLRWYDGDVRTKVC